MSKKRIKTGKMDNLGRVRLGSIRNKNDWNNASKRLFGSFSHSGIPGFLFRLFYSQEQNSRNIFWNIFRNKFLFRNIPNERALGVVTLLYSLLVQKTEIYGRTVFFSEFTFFRLDSQIFFTLSTVLILHLYYTYIYSFNIYLPIILLIPTLLIHALLYNTYMLLAGWEVRIGKNCDRGRKPRAVFASPRSQFFAIRTDPKPANNIFIFLFLPQTRTQLGFLKQLCHLVGFRAVYNSNHSQKL